MKLYHFTSRDVLVPENREQIESGPYSLKPRGLWVSDETEEGWSHWIKSEELNWIDGANKFELEVNLEKILVLSTPSEIRKLPTIPSILGSELRTGVPWDRIAQEWKGILITPYQWECRRDTIWYYGWDCASGCIWDVTAIESVERID